MIAQQQLAQAMQAVIPRIRAWRQDFHAHPEPGWMEFRTAAIAIRTLQDLGYSIVMGQEAMNQADMQGVPPAEHLKKAQQRALAQGADPKLVEQMDGGKTGFWAELFCGEGPCIAVRFDMDCNELQESCDSTHRPVREAFTSKHAGCMHACGHDGHVASGLALATVLQALQTHLRGRIRLIFQPAEEGARGAQAMLTAGAVRNVDVLLGFHVGFQANRPGDLICGTRSFLATSKFDVHMTGKAAHAAAAPEQGKNALLAACAAVNNLYAIARHGEGSTRINVGKLQGGEDRNIIAPHSFFQYETRGTTAAVNAYMREESLRIIQAAAHMWDCTCKLHSAGGCGSGDSDLPLARRVAGLAAAMPCFTNIIESADFKATEDFASLLQAVQAQGGQGTYMQVGATRSAGHHSSDFDFDEQSLDHAVELLARIILFLPIQQQSTI